jgi:hypothetical protein
MPLAPPAKGGSEPRRVTAEPGESFPTSAFPTSAFLINPIGGIAAGALIDGLAFALPVNLQLGARVVALDVQAAAFFGSLRGGMVAIGPRFLLNGRGLDGFYLVPRGGYGSLGGLAFSAELGYAYTDGHFVMNVGGGVLVSDGRQLQGGVGPLLNLSLGFCSS